VSDGPVSSSIPGLRRWTPPPEHRAATGPYPVSEAGRRHGVLSIGSFYDEVESALSSAFPRNRHVWVRGEVHHHLSDHRSGHLYLDLVDPVTTRG
jgi:hypothetical protein